MTTTAFLGYLEDDYLEEPYLTPIGLAQTGMQVEIMIVDALDERGMQVEITIDADDATAMQVEITIDADDARAMQVDLIHAVAVGMQCRFILYNAVRLRVLCDFPSRGVTGMNWTATSTAAGHFDVNNVNTDIVEERWQSAPGVTSVVLTCDTEIVQGVAIDTLAFLNHNLTTSAVVTAEGSDSPSFATIEQTFAIDPTRINAYYIAPVFAALQSVYWRFIISDPTNPDGHLFIGTIVFGTAVIFQGECFTDPMRRRRRHFADKVPTEGHTNVSNDRALKRLITLDFKQLKYDGGNWEALDHIFDTDRTSLKCLWIPTPQEPERFAVFAKIAELPEESHNDFGEASDTLDLTFDLDESL